MSIFENIVYRQINIHSNIFSPKYDNINKMDTIDGIHKIFFYGLIHNKITNLYKSKLHFLHDTINNFYFSKKDKERNDFIEHFRKIQRTYHTLNRFCFLYKIKKSKLIVNTDLQLNEIKLGQKNVISIYHNNCNYLFTIQDLLKIIYTSLTNTYAFFCEPITIKNPYNNLPFEKSILYYIYFCLNNTYIGYIKNEHIDIFLKFKQCNFNMTDFVDSYEYILREYAIKNYITNSTKTQIKTDIFKMIREYNVFYSNYQIDIDNDFPTDTLIRIMKPYFLIYLTSHYSLVPRNRTESRFRLINKLKQFQQFNPAFGRKTIVFKGGIKNNKYHIEFIREHKKFNICDIKKFMTNHLTYKYNYDNNNEDNNNFEDINVTTYHIGTDLTYEHYYDESPDEDSIS